MKKSLLVIFTCLALSGCGEKETSRLPKALDALDHTTWNRVGSVWDEDAILRIWDTDATYRGDKFSGEGTIESMDNKTIVFSDFIATTTLKTLAIKIEKAEYDFHGGYLHRLTVHYREDINEPFNPLDPPEWIWSDITTCEFYLDN